MNKCPPSTSLSSLLLVNLNPPFLWCVSVNHTMHRRLRQILCSVKEHSSVSFAKIATVGGFCDIDLVIVKATAPDDLPLQEKYIHELFKIFSVSSLSFHSFSLCFTRRFGKTHCWKVALKCLLLLHRLLRALPECSPFRTELLWARSKGFLCLNPCHFHDESSSTPEDYTKFIRSYAQLLNEALECSSLASKVGTEDHEEEEMGLQERMREVGRMLEVLPQLQSLIDRVMECVPTAVAARSFNVQTSMKHIIRDSFLCYTTFRREIVLVLDNLIQMPYRSCTLAFGIYKKAASQASQLSEFYDWCKAKGFCGSYEYPFIDRIPQIQIQALETFLNGMWELTDQSSSVSSTSPSSWVETRSTSIEDHEEDKQLVTTKGIIVSTEWENFEENGLLGKLDRDEQMAPLIQLEDSADGDDWEALLEASIGLPNIVPNNFWIYPNGLTNSSGHWKAYQVHKNDLRGEEENQWQIQAYNHSPHNPFCQVYRKHMPEEENCDDLHIQICNPAPSNPFRQRLYLTNSSASSGKSAAFPFPFMFPE